MTVIKKLCPAGLKNNPNRLMKAINYITVHCTGNYTATATAANHANYLFGGSGGNQTSWHYTVDAKDIYQSFNDNQECWDAGDGSGPGNSTSIGIEICVHDKVAFKQACQNAALLVFELLKKHNLSIDKVVQHNKWSGKNCPEELRSGAWGVTWDDFISMVKANLASPISSVPPISTPDTKLYRVQLGAYSVKANADALLERVKKAGFSDAFITTN